MAVEPVAFQTEFDWQLLFGQFRYIAALGVLLVGWIAGYLIGQANKRILQAAGVPEMVEGTPFERTAQSLGTSTVALVARLSSWFIYGVAILTALHVAQLLQTQLFWIQVTDFIPDLFVALLVLIVGFVIADKAELIVSERLRSVKLPEVGVLPKIVKYSVVYIAALIALSQIDIATAALMILLAAYALAVIAFSMLAFWDLLRASAAGIYLLLKQPYGIGDEIALGPHRGIVQEVDMFVTRIESDGEEYIVPNHRLFAEGVVRIRN